MYQLQELLKQNNGRHIRCSIRFNKDIIAYVYVDPFDSNVYLFQNVACGNRPSSARPQDYGYKYSWVLDSRVDFIEFVHLFNEDMFKSLDELLK